MPSFGTSSRGELSTSHDGLVMTKSCPSGIMSPNSIIPLGAWNGYAEVPVTKPALVILRRKTALSLAGPMAAPCGFGAQNGSARLRQAKSFMSRTLSF